MWALGINGTNITGKNPEGRAVVGRAASRAGVFTHSAVNNDALQDAQDKVRMQKLQASVDKITARSESASGTLVEITPQAADGEVDEKSLDLILSLDAGQAQSNGQQSAAAVDV